MKPNGTTEIDATKLGAGNITYNGTDDAGLFDWGWIVHLNEDPGYGIEIILDELSVDASADEYLILSGGKHIIKKFSSSLHQPNGLKRPNPGPNSKILKLSSDFTPKKFARTN